ncbi:MAG: helix-turn-helix domain-containing protein [Acutalibacter sp.]
MKVLLAQKLREFRKKQGLTQEQLAEAMGVTVGAVSKWESGSSTPDVSLVLELADFFETSVDVLLGYTQQSASLEDSVCRLRELRTQKDYEAAFRESEKALQRFPNNFQVVYESARIYQLAGLERCDKAALIRCQELYRRSLELISQNEDREISPVSIYIAIANAMHSAGDVEGALKLLKEYNVEGVNNVEIGTILAKEKETSQEALNYLTRALLSAETSMLQFSVGYANACLHLDRPAQALEFNRLLYQFIQGLKEPGKASYLDKSQVILLVLNVFACFQLGDRERTKEYLRQARQLALRFDAAPSYGLEHHKFITLQRDAAAYDDFGPTALEGVEAQLKDNESDYPGLWALWEEVCHEEA